jgi:hypothetical protein
MMIDCKVCGGHHPANWSHAPSAQDGLVEGFGATPQADPSLAAGADDVRLVAFQVGPPTHITEVSNNEIEDAAVALAANLGAAVDLTVDTRQVHAVFDAKEDRVIIVIPGDGKENAVLLMEMNTMDYIGMVEVEDNG